MTTDPTRPGIVPALVDAPFHDRAYRESISFGRGVRYGIAFSIPVWLLIIAGVAWAVVYA